MALGDLNATLAKMVALNLPSGMTKLVEPFGDGGTLAVYLGKRIIREHQLNIVGEELFQVFVFLQQYKSIDLKKLRGMDWIGSPEAFAAAEAITASEGIEAFYKFQYLKAFGTAGATPDAPRIFDFLKLGSDVKNVLNRLPLIQSGLKRVTLTNDEPFSVMAQAGSGFLLLLPQAPEDVANVRAKLARISAPFFFAGKAKNSADVIEMASENQTQNVMAVNAATIMMATLGVVWNYDSRLKPLSEEIVSAAQTK